MSRRALFAAIFAAGMVVEALVFGALSTFANQSNTWSPTTGKVTGLSLTTNYNNALSALQSCNSGAAPPANDQTGLPVQGQCWLNTGTSPFTVQQYDGTLWVTLGWLDTANHQWVANNAGGTGSVASGTTADLGSVPNPVVSVTGSTTINSFGSSALPGATKFINFAGAMTLTNSSSLLLPNGGANITTASGDTAIATYLGSGNWRVVSYTRGAGLGAGSVTASFLATSAVAYGTPCLNCTVSASVGGNALTIALKTLAGADPSVSDPVTALVPNSTGGYAAVQQTSALSLTLPSGASLGTVGNQGNRIWLAFFNNGGSLVIGAYNTLDSTALSIVPWDETSAATGTGISGSSTNPQTWYTASGVSGKNFRVFAAVEAKQSTAGLWASSPTKVTMFGPGVKKPLDPVQRIPQILNSPNSVSSSTFAAITGATVAITPRSDANLIHVEAYGNVDNNNNNESEYSISRGTTANTNIIGARSAQGPGSKSGIGITADDLPSATSSTTYAVQGKSGSGNAQFPSVANGLMVVTELEI